MTNDIPGTLTLNQLTFAAGAPTYSLGGNGLDFQTNNAGGTPQIVSNSTNRVDIYSDLSLTNSLTLSNVGDVRILGRISGAGGLVKTGPGTLTFNGPNNTFTGGVTFSDGTVDTTYLGALGTGGMTFDGGTFEFGPPSPNIMTATPIALTVNGGTIGVARGVTLTASAPVTGPGGLTKTGPGILVLGGMNTYGGPTTISGGTLVIPTGAALGTGNVIVGSAGTLAGGGTINGPTEIAGTVAPGSGGAGLMHFSAPMTWDAGGSYAFAYSAVTNLMPGGNYTSITSSSMLNLSGVTTANPFTIAINSLAQTNGVPVTYILGAFSNGGAAGGITGFNPAAFAFSGTYSGTPAVSLDATQNQLLLTFTPALLTSLTWTGTTNSSWNNPTNWYPALPIGNVNTRLTFGATASASMINDIPGTLILNQLAFTATAPIYTLTGNGLDFRTSDAGLAPQIVSASANPVTIGSAVTLTNNLTATGAGAVTLNGPISGAGGITYAGTGTLTLGNAGNTFVGGTVVQDGTLAVTADTAFGSGPVTIASAFATLSYAATTTTARSFTLNGGTLAVGPGATLTLHGSLISSGYLGGSGTFATDPSTGARFANVTSLPSVTINSNSGADQFLNFTNGGAFMIAPNSSATPLSLSGFNNQGLGSVTLAGASRLNVANFQSTGVVTINPAAVGSGQFTLLTNTGTSALGFNGGSRTYIGTPATVGPTNNPNYVAGVDLHGSNAVIAGAIVVNNGFVTDSVGGGSMIVDYGALYKGSGTTFVNVITQNGGRVQAGNSPGAAAYGNLTIGPGGIGNFLWQINNATGTAGPTPDQNNQVSGWSQLQAHVLTDPITHVNTAGNLTWTATSTPGNQFMLSLQTLINPTTVGIDNPGPMANFDPWGYYLWPIIKYQGTYSGPTSSAALTADTLFDISGFANPVYTNSYFGGGFYVALDQVNKSIDVGYFIPVPEPGSFALVGFAAFAFAVRRRYSRARV
jgi:autotransporter-associated beta strand protein